MNLRQLTPWNTTGSTSMEDPLMNGSGRCLSLLAEGATMNMLDVDTQSYQEFRASIGRLAMQIPDRMPNADKLVIIQAIIHEFEGYRKDANGKLRDRQNGWRVLSATLLQELLVALGIDTASEAAVPLVQKITSLTNTTELQAYRDALAKFLHPRGGEVEATSPLKIPDRSTHNNNAAGLRGGGVAVEHLRAIMESGGRGFVVLFGLGCLDVVSERFGGEAVQDCLMAVSAFLTSSLHSDDIIYHWSDSSLLAILQGRPNERIISAELRRIASYNRDITINIGGHAIMLRVPMDFDITAISQFQQPEDLYKLSPDAALTR